MKLWIDSLQEQWIPELLRICDVIAIIQFYLPVPSFGQTVDTVGFCYWQQLCNSSSIGILFYRTLSFWILSCFNLHLHLYTKWMNFSWSYCIFILCYLGHIWILLVELFLYTIGKCQLVFYNPSCLSSWVLAFYSYISKLYLIEMFHRFWEYLLLHMACLNIVLKQVGPEGYLGKFFLDNTISPSISWVSPFWLNRLWSYFL